MYAAPVLATLLTWSDRGAAGPKPGHHGQRPSQDRGPVMRLVCECDSEERYERAIVLTSASGHAPARELARELDSQIPEVELLQVELRDPSDYSELFAALSPVVERLSSVSDIDVLLSAGTPQMQTLWVILVKAGLLNARLLQVIPAAFVPSVHPKAVREVRLDIEGFPEIRAMRDEVVRLRARAQRKGPALVGDSPPMRELANRMGRVAPSELPVLIHGETGTGKELVAREIHRSSHRSSGPLVSENCGALSESVLASELFGHEKGAFTGAVHRKRGLFEQAHGGTIFLDEVGELSPRVQVSLLRVLQDGTLRRLGSETTIRVDVRVIAATHRNLSELVREGRFREDLYYRLQGVALEVPPLRERPGDLDALIAHFLAEVGSELRISKEAYRLLESHHWPGNVRQLRAEVMRWHVFCDRWVRPEDLDASIRGRAQPSAPTHAALPSTTLAHAVESAEKSALETALEECGGNLSRSSRLLGIDRNTLKRKIKKYGLSYPGRSAGRPKE